jgi:hypothetical protein
MPPHLAREAEPPQHLLHLEARQVALAVEVVPLEGWEEVLLHLGGGRGDLMITSGKRQNLSFKIHSARPRTDLGVAGADAVPEVLEAASATGRFLQAALLHSYMDRP